MWCGSNVSLILFFSILFGLMAVDCLKMSKSSAIVADNELNHLRTQLLTEFVNQIKDSISIGRSCHEQLRLIDGQELVESGQNLLVLIKSRENDFTSIFGEKPEIIDRIVGSIEQKVFICNSEAIRQNINSMLKIYSRPVFHNRTTNLVTKLKAAETIALNLTSHFKMESAKSILYSLQADIAASIVLAERCSEMALVMSEESRVSQRYFYSLFSRALSDSFQSLIINLFHFSNMIWQIYIQPNPKIAIPVTLYPFIQRDQKKLENFMHEQQWMEYTYFHVFHGKFRVKSRPSSFLFYVKSNDNFVLKIDNGICSDQAVSSDQQQYAMNDDDSVSMADFTCEAYLDENTVVDIYLFIVLPHLTPISSLSPSSMGSLTTAGNAPFSLPQLFVAREDTLESVAIKLNRLSPTNAMFPDTQKAL